jgi:hypothetical protein
MFLAAIGSISIPPTPSKVSTLTHYHTERRKTKREEKKVLFIPVLAEWRGVGVEPVFNYNVVFFTYSFSMTSPSSPPPKFPKSKIISFQSAPRI